MGNKIYKIWLENARQTKDRSKYQYAKPIATLMLVLDNEHKLFARFGCTCFMDYGA